MSRGDGIVSEKRRNVRRKDCVGEMKLDCGNRKLRECRIVEDCTHKSERVAGKEKNCGGCESGLGVKFYVKIRPASLLVERSLSQTRADVSFIQPQLSSTCSAAEGYIFGTYFRLTF